jgi:hypothetical protein
MKKTIAPPEQLAMLAYLAAGSFRAHWSASCRRRLD